VPTLKEQGIDAIYVQNRGLVAPGGIPEEARKTLEDAMLRYTKTKIYKDYISEGMLSESWMDGPTFGKWNEKEYVRYQGILKDMGLLK
jgi:putative tricarboxylic transport membrane protein